jgi:rhodanese-related sulfurtransferase
MNQYLFINNQIINIMKTNHFFKSVIAIVTLSVFTFTSCIEEVEQPKIDHFKVMVDYMKANNLDLNNMTDGWVIDAAAINTAGAANFHIIDIRSAADFTTKGRIQGAINSTLANVLTAAQGATKPIVVTCYTGQNAAVAVAALRLSGYPTARIMKWGMSSWNPVFDSWTTNVSNQGKGHANWSTTNTVKTPALFALPAFDATQFTAADTTGAAILAKRVSYMLSQGFRAVSAADVLANPNNFFIVNYWTEADVNTYGHIKNSYRLMETLKLAGDGIKNLDPATTNVIYCWTGQTSALAASYLTVLGYDAKGLRFGCNNMINADLLKNKWSATEIKDFAYVTGN